MQIQFLTLAKLIPNLFIRRLFFGLMAFIAFLFSFAAFQSFHTEKHPVAEANARAYIAQHYRSDIYDIGDVQKYYILPAGSSWPDYAHIVIFATWKNPISPQPVGGYIRLGLNSKDEVTRDIDGFSFERPY